MMLLNPYRYAVDYQPQMQRFDGDSGLYVRSNHSESGNQVTMVLSFRCSPQLVTEQWGHSLYLCRREGYSYEPRIRLWIYSNSNVNAGKIAAQSRGAGPVDLFFARTANRYDDGNIHSVFVSFNSSTGAYTFKIDGATPTFESTPLATTGTIISSTSTRVWCGGVQPSYAWFDGDIGFVGHRNAYLTNHTDFFNGADPRPIDHTNWTQWGGQPEVWHETGDLVNNRGSLGAFSLTPTVTAVDR